MRAASIILPVIIAMAVGGAFEAGRYVGRFDAQRKSSVAMRELDESSSARTLFILTSAIDNLRNSRAAQADIILVRYAKLQALKVAECSKSATCSQLAGSHIQDPAELERVMSLSEIPPATMESPPPR